MEKIFSYAWRGKRGIEVEENKEGESDDDHYVDDEQGRKILQISFIIFLTNFFPPLQVFNASTKSTQRFKFTFSARREIRT